LDGLSNRYFFVIFYLFGQSATKLFVGLFWLFEFLSFFIKFMADSNDFLYSGMASKMRFFLKICEILEILRNGKSKIAHRYHC
jgi:hypothetical protein